MKIESEDFRVQPGETVKLKNWKTRIKPCYESRGHYQEILDTLKGLKMKYPEQTGERRVELLSIRKLLAM
jgi:hypothetical protein